MNTNFKTPYFIGFILSLIFTIIPFYIIKYDFFDKKTLTIVALSCAAIQIYIHLIYFLHIKHIINYTGYFISLIFTIFILFTFVLGSIWIMIHLHSNLMN